MGYDLWQSCLFAPGLTRTECASWVQACGSVAAIGAAVWIAHRATKTSQQLARDQAQQMQRAYERARIERHLEQLGPVLELFDAALTELDHVHMLAMTTVKRGEWAVDPKELSQLKLVRKALDEIPVHTMPTAATAGALLGGRVLVGNASSVLEELVTLVDLALQPTGEHDRDFQEAVRLVRQERERMHQSLLRLVEPTEKPFE